MSTELVSVVIPTYNRAYCIADSVGSVLRQTYENLEVIVVDDGSTDNTKEVLDSLGDSRVRYASQQNAGACVARNHGIELARGTYVAFHDSDDLWLPQKLEKQVAYLQTQSKPCVFCRMETVLEEGATYIQSADVEIHPSEKLKEAQLDLDRLLSGNFVSTQTLMGRREVFLEEAFDPRLPRFQDWDLAIRLMAKDQLGFVDEVLVRQIIRKDSMSTNEKRLVEALQIMAEKLAVTFSGDPKRYALFLRKAALSLRGIDRNLSKAYFSQSLHTRFLPLTPALRAYTQLLWLVGAA